MNEKRAIRQPNLDPDLVKEIHELRVQRLTLAKIQLENLVDTMGALLESSLIVESDCDMDALKQALEEKVADFEQRLKVKDTYYEDELELLSHTLHKSILSNDG